MDVVDLNDGPIDSLAFNIANGVETLHPAMYTAPVVPPVGTMLDNGDPCSAIGYNTICAISTTGRLDWHGELEAIAAVFSHCPFWKYDSGEHNSEALRILETVVIPSHAANGTILLIQHLVLEGASQ